MDVWITEGPGSSQYGQVPGSSLTSSLPFVQVLSTGEEVRLQRNALNVLEHPTGLESVSIGQRLGQAVGVLPLCIARAHYV